MKAKVLIMCTLLAISISITSCTTKNKENSVGKEDSVKMLNQGTERVEPAGE